MFSPNFSITERDAVCSPVLPVIPHYLEAASARWQMFFAEPGATIRA
jgi:hypothetical protein